ncbi:MAG: 50S ribosomal protein L4 [Gammaproteobacteria bacterium]
MQIQSISQSGSAGQVSVSDEVFGRDYNESLIHQVVTAYMAGARSGTKAQKRRSDVRGGGAKPWRQKGTGRARAGTSRSPIWRGGGRAFAASPRKFEQKVNRKMYRGAVRSILSELARQERLIVVDDFQVETPKTRAVIDALASLNAPNALIVCSEVSENLYLSARNIPRVGIVDVAALDPVLLVSFDKIVITQSALNELENSLK